MAHGAHGASGRVSSGNRPDGEHEGPGGVDGGSQRSAVPPGLRRRRRLRRGLQKTKRRSATPKPVSVGERVTVLEKRSVDEITRLNLYYAQSAAMFEYDGAMVQDLSAKLLRAMACIDVLEAAVMAQPRADDCSAGLSASNGTVVPAGPAVAAPAGPACHLRLLQYFRFSRLAKEFVSQTR